MYIVSNGSVSLLIYVCSHVHWGHGLLYVVLRLALNVTVLMFLLIIRKSEVHVHTCIVALFSAFYITLYFVFIL